MFVFFQPALVLFAESLNQGKADTSHIIHRRDISWGGVENDKLLIPLMSNIRNGISVIRSTCGFENRYNNKCGIFFSKDMYDVG